MSGLEIRRKQLKLVVKWSCRPDNCKAGRFPSWKGRERLQNILKSKMHVQNCLLLLNMQMYDVVVAVAKAVLLMF